MRLSLETQKDIYEAFLKNRNKAKVASEFGTSARTVGRIVEKGENGDYKEVGYTFKVGDIVTATEENHYPITSGDFVGEIIGTNNSYVTVKVVKDQTDLLSRYVGDKYTVNPKFLKLLALTEESSEDFEPELETKEEEVKQPSAKYIQTENALVLIVEGEEPLLIDSTHMGFKDACSACENGDFLKAVQLMDVAKAITSFSEGSIKVDTETMTLTYKGMQIHNSLVDKILTMMQNGNEEFKPLVRFFEKTQANPAPDARRQLMKFASASDLTINSEGDLIAFKNVGDDYRPSRAGRYDDNGNYISGEFYDNSVGATCKMPRELVDDNINKTCSHGLHVASINYLESCWGYKGRTLKVAVNPMNIVAIPTDYSDSKARVCEYKVIEDVTDKLDEIRSTYGKA